MEHLQPRTSRYQPLDKSKVTPSSAQSLEKA
jgi:hypothetical protein